MRDECGMEGNGMEWNGTEMKNGVKSRERGGVSGRSCFSLTGEHICSHAVCVVVWWYQESMCTNVCDLFCCPPLPVLYQVRRKLSSHDGARRGIPAGEKKRAREREREREIR